MGVKRRLTSLSSASSSSSSLTQTYSSSSSKSTINNSSMIDISTSSVWITPPPHLSRRGWSSSLLSSPLSSRSSCIPSSSVFSSLPLSSSCWSAIVLVLLLLNAQMLETVALDPLGGRVGGGGVGGSVMGRSYKSESANNRGTLNREGLDKKTESVRSGLKLPREKKGVGFLGKKPANGLGNEKSQNNKDQHKDGLLKQLQDHEDKYNLKQQEIHKREVLRHQRLQKMDEEEQQRRQQQQHKLEVERSRQAANIQDVMKERDKEQKLVMDVHRKAAVEKSRQKQLSDQAQLAQQDDTKINVNNNNNKQAGLGNNPPVGLELQQRNSNNKNTDIFDSQSRRNEDNSVGGIPVTKAPEPRLAHTPKPKDPLLLEPVMANDVKGLSKNDLSLQGGNNNDNRVINLAGVNSNLPPQNKWDKNKAVDNDIGDNHQDDNNNRPYVQKQDTEDDDMNDNNKDDNNHNHNDNNNVDNFINARNNINGDSYNVNNMNNNNNNLNSNNNNNNNNNVRVEVPPLGGINVNWDWEDFSIMFDNYGGAEMKVRRAPHATTGEPWPMPQYYIKKDDKVFKISKDLRFVPTGHTCDIVEEAMARHLQRVLRGSVEDMYDNLQNAEGTSIDNPVLKYETKEYLNAPTISRIELRVRKACTKYPALDSDETYDLVVKKKKTYVFANEVWGLLRGLETLGQLVWRGTDGILYIKETVVSDYPRFPHRGLHIDSSRHFIFKEVLLDIMDSMEMNKMNVFHWHLTDDQSFPYESKVYPELSRKGAFHPTYVYSLEDVAELVEYARMRGIRVLPEFDTPGHTYAWGLSRPELLTQCFSGNTPVKGYLGPLDPSKNSTYRFLGTLFQEVMDVFKDQFLHLGGDEVPLGCWQSNPEIMAFANELTRKHQEISVKQPSLPQTQQAQGYNNYGGSWSMWSDEIKRVYEYYENRLIKLLNELGHKRKTGVRYIMWQEVMNNNLQLPNDTIIQIWMGDMGDVLRATSMGYNVLYSTCWYLDHIEYGTKWPKYYHCDPVDSSYGYRIDEKKVLGGEAAFWSEYFTNENLIPNMWPRASAVAERLWSHKDVKNLDKAAARLSEHRCRMIKRGINAGEISGPGYCLHSPPKRRLFNDTIGCKGTNCSRLHNFVEIEDIQVHLSQRGGSLSECGNVFSRGDTGVLILLTIICVLVLFMVTVTRSSSRLGRIRHCKNRSILLVFVLLLLVYFLCYTTIGLRAFEFSGSIHKTFQEDKRVKDIVGLDGYPNQKKLINS